MVVSSFIFNGLWFMVHIVRHHKTISQNFENYFILLSLKIQHPHHQIITSEYSQIQCLLSLFSPTEHPVDKLFSILTIIICPAVYFWYFAWPVAMSGADWSCPLQCIGTPWIFGGYFLPFQVLWKKLNTNNSCVAKTINATVLMNSFNPPNILKEFPT